MVSTLSGTGLDDRTTNDLIKPYQKDDDILNELKEVTEEAQNSQRDARDDKLISDILNQEPLQSDIMESDSDDDEEISLS